MNICCHQDKMREPNYLYWIPLNLWRKNLSFFNKIEELELVQYLMMPIVIHNFIILMQLLLIQGQNHTEKIMNWLNLQALKPICIEN